MISAVSKAASCLRLLGSLFSEMRVIILSDRARVGGRTGENESEKKEEKIERSKVREEKEEGHIFRYLSESGTLSHPSARLEVRL